VISRMKQFCLNSRRSQASFSYCFLLIASFPTFALDFSLDLNHHSRTSWPYPFCPPRESRYAAPMFDFGVRLRSPIPVFDSGVQFLSFVVGSLGR
jgi:hypothetical protein